jgi:hypothetical protein
MLRALLAKVSPIGRGNGERDRNGSEEIVRVHVGPSDKENGIIREISRSAEVARFEPISK